MTPMSQWAARFDSDEDETTAGWVGDDRLVIVDYEVGDDEVEAEL